MSDVIRVQCQSCLATIKAKPKHQGKRVGCPGCGEALQIPVETDLTSPDVFEPRLSPLSAPPPLAPVAPVFADEPTMLDDSDFVTDDQFVIDEPSVDEYEDYGTPAPRTRRNAPVRRSRSPVDKRDGLIAVACGILMVLGSLGWTAWMFAIGAFDFSPVVTLVVGGIIIVKGLMGD